ncbi:MAG TPA: cupredoxin domain-containing protein [Sphingomicrobium sp.]|nr:cupredoxin domain-containing protein [Sphingomicrobium sp.]
MSTGGTWWLVKLAGVSLTAGCASCDRAPVAPRTHTIIIEAMKFGPMPSEVQAGDVIEWVNRDIFQHTATARDQSFNIDLAPSASGQTVVKQSGAFPFYCTYHPGMEGRLVIAGR